MIVEILETDKRLGIKKGERYNASRYYLDPNSKIVLESRIPDGYDPMCTQYFDEVKVVNNAHDSSISRT